MGMKKISGLEWTVMTLVIIGSLNWLLVALGNWNIVEMTFGTQGLPGTLGKLLYGLIGLSGLYLLYWITR